MAAPRASQPPLQLNFVTVSFMYSDDYPVAHSHLIKLAVNEEVLGVLSAAFDLLP